MQGKQKKKRKRRGYTAAELAELWDRWERGESSKVIAGALDRGATVYDLLLRYGGIRPRTRCRSTRASRGPRANSRSVLPACSAGHYPAAATRTEESERLLKDTGRKIQRLIPEPTARSLRDHRDSYIRIASNIHVIPFELAFDDVSNLFLGDTCYVGRIQVSEAGVVQPLAPKPSILLIGSVNHADFPSLPAASEELRALSAVLSKWGLRATLLSGKSVTRDGLANVAREHDFQLLHFAGHGIADVDGRAGLVLSDGFASFDELTRMMPTAWVVVLSACSSGRALDEASKGYFHGGASGVVGFVGPVTDEAANAIAVRFYEEVASGATLGEALRIAKRGQQALRPSDYSWASLVLFGDPTRRLKR